MVEPAARAALAEYRGVAELTRSPPARWLRFGCRGVAELTRSPPARWLLSECRGVAELTRSPPARRMLMVVGCLFQEAWLAPMLAGGLVEALQEQRLPWVPPAWA